MANQQFQGLLQQFGLPQMSEEEILAQRNKARLKEALGNIDVSGAPRIERDFRKIGQKVGSALGIKANPSELSPDEQAKADAVAAATAKFEEKRTEDPGLANDPIRNQLEYQKLLAEELIQRGDVATAVQIVTATEQQRKAVEKQDLELEKLGLDIEGRRTQNRATLFNTEKNEFVFKRGELTTVYPKGSSDPNAGFTAYISNEDGSAIGLDGSSVPLGEYTTVRPQSPKTGRAGGRPITPGDLGVPDSEAKGIRDQARAAMRQVDASLVMKEAMEESILGEDGSVNILGAQGGISNGFVKIVDTLQGLARQIGGSVEITNGAGKGRDLAKPGSSMAYVRSNWKELDEDLAQFVPENLRNDSRAREKFYSAMVQAAFAKARAQEPGARQLSDEDFKRAVAAMAGATTDPESFREITFGNIMQDVTAVKDGLAVLPDGVSPDMIIGERGFKAFNEKITRFEEEFGPQAGSFGTAANPGPGLTGEEEEIAPDAPIDQIIMDVLSRPRED